MRTLRPGHGRRPDLLRGRLLSWRQSPRGSCDGTAIEATGRARTGRECEAGGGTMAGLAGAPAPSRIQREWRDWLLFVALAGPNLLLFIIFNYRPLFYNAYLSFHDWDFLSPIPIPVGFDNYVDVFTDPHFHRVLQNTVVLMVCGVCLTIASGMALALLLNQKLVGRDAARSVLFAPYMLSGAAIAVVWVYIFDPNYGLLRVVVSPLGLVPPNWLRDTSWAMVRSEERRVGKECRSRWS